MPSHLELIQEKLDTLTLMVENQNKKIKHLESIQIQNETILEVVSDLSYYANSQRKRQQDIDELKNDLVPIANQMIKLTITELREIGTDFQLEDIMFLLKRLLRDTHLLVEMLARLEAYSELADDLKVLGKQFFIQSINKLDQLEQQGFFTFAEGSWRIIEELVSSISPEKLEALKDRVPMIVDIIQDLTSPSTLEIVNETLEVMNKPYPKGYKVSTFEVLKQLTSQESLQGLSRLIHIIKIINKTDN